MLTQLPVLEAREALFRANIYHFLPDYPASRYDELYRQVCANQRQAADDYRQARPEWIASRCLELGGWLARVQARPGIIATYHTGSYRLLNLCLATAGLPLALLVSAEVAARERQSMLLKQQRLTKDARPDRPLVVLEAEDPHILRKTGRLLAQGYYVVFYVDGNTGAAEGRSTHLLQLPFLAGRLNVRQGIPLLSYLAGVPVYPIRCDRQHGVPHFVCADPMVPHPGETRNDYAVRVMAMLYRFLEVALEQDPATWECWRYIQQWVVGKEVGRCASADLNLLAGPAHRWHVFREQGRRYLIDAKGYIFYPM